MSTALLVLSTICLSACLSVLAQLRISKKKGAWVVIQMYETLPTNEMLAELSAQFFFGGAFSDCLIDGSLQVLEMYVQYVLYAQVYRYSGYRYYGITSTY